MRTSIIQIIFMLLLAGSTSVRAQDLRDYERICSELGFKNQTSAYGECVLELERRSTEQKKNVMSKGVIVDNETETVKNRNFGRQQNYAGESEIIERQREIAELKRRQDEMYQLNQRSVAAQEEVARAQSNANGINLFLNSTQMLLGTGAYARPVPNYPLLLRPCVFRDGYRYCD